MERRETRTVEGTRSQADATLAYDVLGGRRPLPTRRSLLELLLLLCGLLLELLLVVQGERIRDAGCHARKQRIRRQRAPGSARHAQHRGHRICADARHHLQHGVGNHCVVLVDVVDGKLEIS